MKKLISKFFRVATEGATIDGREITGAQIEQMAKNYSPGKYGARIWLEHFRSLLPESLFSPLGDVVELMVGSNDDGKKILLAQLAPLASLVALNQKGEKVFTSIEMDSSFADTGEAYLVGLAVTDSPASTGTEMLAFSQQNTDKFKDNDVLKSHLFSEYIEIENLEFEEVNDDKDKPSLLSKVSALLSKNSDQSDARFTDVDQAVTAIAENQDTVQQDLSAAQSTLAQLSGDVKELRTELSETVAKLEKTPSSTYMQRPPATGTGDEMQADC